MGYNDYEAAYLKSLLERPDVRIHDQGVGTYLYRPGELVVDDAAVERLGELLGPSDAKPLPDEYTEQLGLRRFTVADDTDIPALAAQADEIAPGALTCNHVLLGAPRFVGGPAGDASVAEPLGPTRIESSVGAGISISVLDTGIWPKAPVTTRNRGAADEEELDILPADQVLDHQAGHGTHIAGIVSRLAPGAGIQSIKVLNSMGVGDDAGVTAGLLGGQGGEIINLSLGGPSRGATGFPMTERAIDALDSSTVVVAAAGNAAGRTPFFPAAFKRVISVGAIERAGSGWSRAEFSNFGWWVDACAPGVGIRSIFPAIVEKRGKQRDFQRGFASWDGTSFAAPQVAACIAAIATRDSISAQEAAWRLVHDPALPRLTREGLGTIVDPSDLPLS